MSDFIRGIFGPGIERLVVDRFENKIPMSLPFVTEVNRLTAQAFGCDVPLQETFDHLNEANLGQFVYLEGRAGRHLIGYMLNDQYEFAGRRVNYIGSGFILPRVREKISLFRLLGSISVCADEDVIMVRTQNPEIMSFFIWLAEFKKMILHTPLDERLPHDVSDLVFSRFKRRGLLFPGAYGRCLTGAPVVAATELTKRLMDRLNVSAGDAMVLVAVRQIN